MFFLHMCIFCCKFATKFDNKKYETYIYPYLCHLLFLADNGN